MEKRHTFLTDLEWEAIKTAGKLAGLMQKITWPNRKGYQYDWIEACDKIHQLQHMIMAQAAARAYPELFRLHGEGAAWPQGYGFSTDEETKD